MRTWKISNAISNGTDGGVLYILPGISPKTRALWKLSCLLEAARQSLACIRLCLVCPSCLLGTAWTSYSLVIASGPEVAFVTLAIPVDRSNVEYRVVDRTTSHVPAGTVIPPASPKEIAITGPDRNVVTNTDHAAKQKASPRPEISTQLQPEDQIDQKVFGAVADHVAKRKTSTGPEISTNAAKRTRLSQKVSGAGSSGLAAGDGVEQIDDGTLDDDGQRDRSEFATEDIGNLNDVSQEKEVEAHVGLSGGVRRTTQASSHTPHAPDTQPLDTDVGADEIAGDGNVDPYFEARISNTAGDVLERDLLPFVPGPYYIPYPFDEGSGSESPPYTRENWEEIHGVNFCLRQKELYKDPKVCRTALDRFPTPAETHRLRELSSVELSDRMSVLQCQLITHGSMLNARYDHALKNVERLTKRCAQQTQIIKKQGADLKQQKESTVCANEEVSRLTAELGVLKSRCQTVEHKLSSWDKKHRKYRNERDTLSTEKAKIEEELVGTKSQLEHRERQAEEIQGSIASFFQSDFTPLVRRRLSQEVVGFIPDAKEKFDRAIAAFPDTTSLSWIRVTPSSQPSSATAPLRANTHVRHSTSSPGTFGHTSTPEHLKKKKKFVEKALSALCLDLYGSGQHGPVLPQQLSGCSPCARA
ncbi:hypothetical protein Tco_0195385 [Tanacetum coccineum]